MIRATTVFGVLFAAGLLASCSQESKGTTYSTGGGGQINASECASPVVLLRTGSDSTCPGGNTHAWPVGLEASDCHGWRSLDTEGKEHDNSANDIRCNADGSFSFVQFAASLDCEGTGTLKEYKLNECEQDIPPTLYTVAFDLTCCSDPSNAACKTEVPSVTVEGSTIYFNGHECVP